MNIKTAKLWVTQTGTALILVIIVCSVLLWAMCEGSKEIERRTLGDDRSESQDRGLHLTHSDQYVCDHCSEITALGFNVSLDEVTAGILPRCLQCNSETRMNLNGAYLTTEGDWETRIIEDPEDQLFSFVEEELPEQLPIITFSPEFWATSYTLIVGGRWDDLVCSKTETVRDDQWVELDLYEYPHRLTPQGQWGSTWNRLEMELYEAVIKQIIVKVETCKPLSDFEQDIVTDICDRRETEEEEGEGS